MQVCGPVSIRQGLVATARFAGSTRGFSGRVPENDVCEPQFVALSKGFVVFTKALRWTFWRRRVF